MVVIELEDLFGEGRIIGKDANWIVVNMDAVTGGFDNNTFLSITDDPMKFSDRKLVVEIETA